MEKQDLIEFLSSTKYRDSARTLQEIDLKGTRLKHIYRLPLAQGDDLILKVRSAKDRSIRESIQNLKRMSDSQGLILPNLEVLEAGDFLLLITRYLQGEHLYPNHSDRLPAFFASLARFNRENPVAGPYTSMYCDGRFFETMEEMVEQESAYLLGFWEHDQYLSQIQEALSPMKELQGCLINEDLNLGNMLLTTNDKIVFVDTEWVQRGCILHQFDHVNLLGFDEPAWYTIHQEAKACLGVYFQEMGYSREKANQLIRSAWVLKVLRQNCYWRYFKKVEKYGQEVQRLEIVLGTEDFLG